MEAKITRADVEFYIDLYSKFTEFDAESKVQLNILNELKRYKDICEEPDELLNILVELCNDIAESDSFRAGRELGFNATEYLEYYKEKGKLLKEEIAKTQEEVRHYKRIITLMRE
jgi:hypothetical protein